MGIQVEGLHDAPIPEHARAFFDPEKTRKWIQESAVNAFSKYLNKIEVPDYKLRVRDVRVDDPNKRFTLKEQKQATMDRKDLTQAVKADVDLINTKTNTVVDSKKNLTIAHIPWLTDRNTTIYNGSEYSITSQQRLKPGIYTRVKDTGDIEAHVNVKAGTGSGGKVIFFPEKALFIYQVGTTRIKLYGLLHDLGISDAEMEAAWGKEIFLKNKATFEGDEAEKMYNKIFTY